VQVAGPIWGARKEVLVGRAGPVVLLPGPSTGLSARGIRGFSALACEVPTASSRGRSADGRRVVREVVSGRDSRGHGLKKEGGRGPRQERRAKADEKKRTEAE
jgi:hypothetical protein